MPIFLLWPLVPGEGEVRTGAPGDRSSLSLGIPGTGHSRPPGQPQAGQLARAPGPGGQWCQQDPVRKGGWTMGEQGGPHCPPRKLQLCSDLQYQTGKRYKNLYDKMCI